MALPASVQQTLKELEGHFRRFSDQVSGLQYENQEMQRKLSDISQPAMKVLEAFEEPAKAPKIAFEAPLPGHPMDDLIALSDELPTGASGLSGSLEPHRIRKVSTQMVHKAVHIRKQMMNGSEEDTTLASDKMRKLKNDPFGDMLQEKHHAPPAMTVRSMCNLCFPPREATFMKRFSNGLFFKSITILAIAANTLYLGLVADTNVKNSYKRMNGETVEKPSVIPDMIFTGWFSMEILVKLLAEQLDFILGEDKYWNLFDTALVLESIIGLFLEGSRFSFLRIFRVFRLVRVVKVVRSVKALARLRTMIFAILSSFVDLLWAFLVIVLIVFVFAIFFDNAVADHFDRVNLGTLTPLEVAEIIEIEKLFGNLPETMISLWSAVSGGNDWMTYGELLRQVPSGNLYFAIFNFYVAFCVVGMFNVVTGVFVDSAVCIRTGDEVVQGYLDDLRNTTEEIKGFFKEADMDGSGTLNWTEFQTHMQNPAVKAYFSGLDIDPEEAEIIFTILDGDKSKEIKIDEFVNGTMKLKGSATKLDLMALMYDQTRQNMKFDNLCEFVEEELLDIKKRISQVKERRADPSPPPIRQVRMDPNMPRVIDTSMPRATAIRRR